MILRADELRGFEEKHDSEVSSHYDDTINNQNDKEEALCTFLPLRMI